MFKGQQRRGRIYTVYGVYCDDGSLFAIYRNVFMMLLGLGGDTMKTIEKSVSGGNMVPALNGLSGRVDNDALSMEIKSSLRVFFEEIVTMEEPHASKVIRLQQNLC